MAAPILSYEGLGLVQGEGWLFRGLDVHIGARDRLALIGRNGAGKTTLLRCIADLFETDEGRRTIVAGTNVVLLEQDPVMEGFDTLADWVLNGAAAPPPHEAEAIADQLGVDLSRPVSTASGGARPSRGHWRRSRPCCCSTSRPTTSISPASSGSKVGSIATPARSSRSATIALFSLG